MVVELALFYMLGRRLAALYLSPRMHSYAVGVLPRRSFESDGLLSINMITVENHKNQLLRHTLASCLILMVLFL